jgi:transcriptional regulator with XRE-family HTH domain
MTPRQTLKSARLAAGLTYREVGQAAGLDGSTIAHFEAGTYNPSDSAARRWQEALTGLLAERSRQSVSALEALK